VRLRGPRLAPSDCRGRMTQQSNHKDRKKVEITCIKWAKHPTVGHRAPDLDEQHSRVITTSSDVVLPRALPGGEILRRHSATSTGRPARRHRRRGHEKRRRRPLRVAERRSPGAPEGAADILRGGNRDHRATLAYLRLGGFACAPTRPGARGVEPRVEHDKCGSWR